MSADTSRSNSLSKALDALLWVLTREAHFGRKEMARELEISPRSALRYLHCLEARSLVVSDRAQVPWVWTSVDDTYTVRARR